MSYWPRVALVTIYAGFGSLAQRLSCELWKTAIKGLKRVSGSIL